MYKRQVIAFIHVFINIFNTFNSVSYTHLDVYKRQPLYRVGRAESCEITITEQEVDKLIFNISKVQFKIWKEPMSSGGHLAYLEDFSSNGTFVNRQKVGTNKKVIISNEDVISLAQPQNKGRFL